MAAATTADVASAADVEELAAVDTESHPSKDLLNREAETRTADKKRQKAQVSHHRQLIAVTAASCIVRAMLYEGSTTQQSCAVACAVAATTATNLTCPCMQKRLAAEFVQAMSSSIQSLEESMQSGTAAEKELAKQRRLQLREVLKAVTDPSRSTDERLRFLQGKFVQMVQNMNKQDQDMLAVQAKLDEAVKESMQGWLSGWVQQCLRWHVCWRGLVHSVRLESVLNHTPQVPLGLWQAEPNKCKAIKAGRGLCCA